MKTINEIKSILKFHKNNLQEKYKIKQLGLFGSFCRGEENEDSDIDILVEFSESVGLEFIDLAFELERILGSKVDLVSKSGIKPKYFKYVKKDLVYV